MGVYEKMGGTGEEEGGDELGGGGGRIDGCWEGRGVLFITETGPGQTDGTGPPLPPAAAASPAPHPSRTGT